MSERPSASRQIRSHGDGAPWLQLEDKTRFPSVVAPLRRGEVSRVQCLFLNLLWLLSTLPGWLAFLIALRFPRAAQRRLLLRTCRANCRTDFGQRHGLGGVRDEATFQSAVPVGGYEQYEDAIAAVQSGRRDVLTAESVLLLQPTSGTTARSKLIPFTDGLRRQFQAAVDPWMADLFLRHPSLLLGAQYWSISPQAPQAAGQDVSSVPVGFSDDGTYLGRAARRALQGMGVVPPAGQDALSFQYLTLVSLLRERNLRLISVWHPSFLTVLLDMLPARKEELVKEIERGGACGAALPQRAREIAALDLEDRRAVGRLWPKLRVISCWGGHAAAPWIERLRETFPTAHLQPKGLIATEGIVTFPFGRNDRHICAVRSHVLEFIDPDTGAALSSWEVHAGREYLVALTTAGGLYRYALGDRVRVTGFAGRTPCLEFIGRKGVVSDLVGEKLHLSHVEDAVAAAEQASGVCFRFAMLAPDQAQTPPRYALYVNAASVQPLDWARIGESVEDGLAGNFHYRHARNLGQLGAVAVCPVPPDADAIYRDVLLSRGIKAGDIKFLRLMPDYGWREAFGRQRPCRSSRNIATR